LTITGISGQSVGVDRLVDDFATRRPNDVVRRGGEVFVAHGAVEDLLNEAAERGVRVLGMEGFLIADDAVYPALSRIADLSSAAPPTAAARARSLLSGPWALPPTPEDQMAADAYGRYVVAVVLDG
jgi:hypothetical protein